MHIRQTTVAGSFYPRDEKQLIKQLKSFFKSLQKNEKKSNCIIAPHAGYAYSGKTAAYSFNALQKTDSFIILSPNHTGIGPNISISNADKWETPLGEIEVDENLRKKLLSLLAIESDDLAHIQEHSIEVQLPFLQFLFKRFTFLPITLMTNNLNELIELGKKLFALSKSKKFALIASSDFSHFVPLQEAKERDLDAIEKIKKMDLEGFHQLVRQKNLSICGSNAIIAAMQYCKEKNLKKATLLKYDTSATVTKDDVSVVGYAAIKFG